jgi:hemerythrin-like domain-containing protein
MPNPEANKKSRAYVTAVTTGRLNYFPVDPCLLLAGRDPSGTQFANLVDRLDDSESSVTSADGQPHFDGREMFMVHDMLRREFALMPALVSDVTVGNRDRAETVGDHIDTVVTVLHHHHRTEVRYVWPVLLERCAESLAPLLHLVECQHEQVAVLGYQVEKALSTWRDGVSAESRDDLIDALHLLNLSMREHLSDEEESIVPLMEQHVTAAEWSEMVAKAAAGSDPEQLPLEFGMLMYEGDPEIVDLAIARMPPHAGTVIRQLAARNFAEHSQRVHGTTTPQRSSELWS